MNQDLSFIEVQFPVSKVSKESYKERKANLGQTLTGLGKWWGRKPLILVRSTILGLLMPASVDPVKDREIFLKILTMDNDGLWLRRSKPVKDDTVIENLTLKEVKEFFEVPVDLFMAGEADQNILVKKALKSDLHKLKWKAGLSKIQKEKATRIAFDRLSYDERLIYCLRPEEVHLTEERQWQQINSHLGTNAKSLQELVQELGTRKFGHNAIVGDSFAGGGSIPFEAARMGCDTFASDLNPVAGLLTWADLNIAGASDENIQKLRAFQQKVYDAVDKQVQEWGIETNEQGHRANAYLYCVETDCPECGYQLPLSPSWIIGKGTMTIAVLKDNGKNGFDIEIKSGVSPEELNHADDLATVRDGSTWCPHCKKGVPITVLRKDRKDENGHTISGLRQWEKTDFMRWSAKFGQQLKKT
jgi:putative DNA methylase